MDDHYTYDERDKKTKYSFLEEQKQEIDKQMKESSVNFLSVDIFKDKSGQVITNEPKLPYETIDLIFNRNNVYANMQYHDPAHIMYNLYDKNAWLPYFLLKGDQLFRGKVEPFYSISNFGSPYTPSLINRMKDNLIKEMRIGITAARSGLNLQTRFQKKVTLTFILE